VNRELITLNRDLTQAQKTIIQIVLTLA